MRLRFFLPFAACVLTPALVRAQAPNEGKIVLLPDDDPATPAANPTGRAVVLTAPVMDGAAYLGDATITIDAQDRIELSGARLLELLGRGVDPKRIEDLRAELGRTGALSTASLLRAGVGIRYNPQALQIELEIAADARASRSLALSEINQAALGSYVEPARVSAYVNVRGSIDYSYQGEDRGLATPVMFLDGAARVRGVVLESEANWQPGASNVDFQRRGTRLVYDDLDSLIRWSAGDLLPLGRGFQSSPEMAGVSIFRSYTVLDPQTVVRPRGGRSFRLDRRSSVEVRINDQLVRRIELDPGNYDLRDFPFTQGANDIRLTITDDAGRQDTLRYNLFLDQTQLAEGLSEFGLYAGVLAPLGLRGPNYSGELAATGFYRRGLSDRLTLGGNFEMDGGGWLAGAEAVIGTGFGSLATYVAGSRVDRYGAGWATLVNFQRPIIRSDGRSDTFSLSLEARSRDFGPIGTVVPINRFRYELGAGYSRTLTDTIYAGVDGRYSKGRGDQRDVHSVRASMGWRINPDLSFTADARYERDGFGRNIGAFLSLSYQLSRRSTVRADYDTRFNRARLSYQTYSGAGTGSYNINADVERSDFGIGATANANYFHNRAELGLSHFGSFDGEFGPTSQRTSFRFGSALAFADGSVSVGRPVFDSFAIVRAHRSLKGAEVLLDPSDAGPAATTGALGTAIYPSLSSYSERTIIIDAPGAPSGVDLGQGSFRLLPPYRGGYLLTVGSDYAVSAIGRLVNRQGAPVALVAGTATELAHPEREPLALFTNADGRFGVSGLAPGRWRIAMLDAEESRFEILVPVDAEGVLRLGDLSPVAR